MKILIILLGLTFCSSACNTLYIRYDSPKDQFIVDNRTFKKLEWNNNTFQEVSQFKIPRSLHNQLHHFVYDSKFMDLKKSTYGAPDYLSPIPTKLITKIEGDVQIIKYQKHPDYPAPIPFQQLLKYLLTLQKSQAVKD